ncbi:MAG: IS3 family transposase [Bacilli bacterium]|nr:IS3 family transposase [Bacilli bacterium]
MLRNKYSVNTLCKMLECSKSGYYDWIKLGRPKNKAFNESTNEIVVKMHEKNKTWGIRQIRMQIKKIYGLIVTNFAVYRYMRLNDIQSITRKKTHRYSKLPHHQIPNLLQRNFTTFCSNCKWSIDISYIFATDGVKYLCAIKDMYDKSIIAYTISKTLDLPFVLNTVQQAVNLVPWEQRKNLILHSDQGFHFTNIVYQKLLADNNIIQSISAKGSSVDNVPIESFFSTLKSECIYLIKNLKVKDIDETIDKFIEYYNNERLQEKIKELTPFEFRELTLNSVFF